MKSKGYHRFPSKDKNPLRLSVFIIYYLLKKKMNPRFVFNCDQRLCRFRKVFLKTNIISIDK